MDDLYFKPWEGRNYRRGVHKGKRVLVLGGSTKRWFISKWPTAVTPLDFKRPHYRLPLLEDFQARSTH